MCWAGSRFYDGGGSAEGAPCDVGGRRQQCTALDGALLASVIPGRLDERVRDRIIAESGGNPLALLELPHGVTAAELAGGFGLPSPLPVAGRIEQSFLWRIAPLPEVTQRLLLLAAAEPTGDPALLWRAADRLGIGVEAAAPAVADGLLAVGARVIFRHPLVRSAVYRAAPIAERRRAHGALAGATDPGADPDRRAWHRAQAAPGPDEDIAAELERSAGRAQARGGFAAAAVFLDRASELTTDPTRRGARALAAAQAKFDAGAPDRAYELLMTAEMAPLDELQHARVDVLRAQVAFARGRGGDAPALMLAAARRLEPLDAGLAREAYLEAFGAALFAGRLGGAVGVREVADAARVAGRAASSLQPARALDLLLEGLVTRSTEGYPAGLAPLRRESRAVQALLREHGLVGREVRFALGVSPELWDDEAWHELASLGVRTARDAWRPHRPSQWAHLPRLPAHIRWRVRQRSGAPGGGSCDRRGHRHCTLRLRLAAARRVARPRDPGIGGDRSRCPAGHRQGRGTGDQSR